MPLSLTSVADVPLYRKQADFGSVCYSRCFHVLLLFFTKFMEAVTFCREAYI